MKSNEKSKDAYAGGFKKSFKIKGLKCIQSLDPEHVGDHCPKHNSQDRLHKRFLQVKDQIFSQMI